MRFLVIGKNRSPVPPDIAPALFDAMIAWVNKIKASGKVEALWGTAGVAGGGAILNVDSADELDAIMIEFPFAPFSEITIVLIVDIVESLQRSKQAMLAMMQGGGGR